MSIPGSAQWKLNFSDFDQLQTGRVLALVVIALRFVNQLLDHPGKFAEFGIEALIQFAEFGIEALILFSELGAQAFKLLIERARLTKHDVVLDFLTIFHVVPKLRDLAFND